VSAPPAPPLVLASTSPQRRAILEQLGIPFEVVPPRFDEEWNRERSDHAAIVERNARGKARSVQAMTGERPVLGVDTTVVWGTRSYGKPSNAEEAAEMLETLSAQEHRVVSGLCLVTPAWEVVDHDVTGVRFRALTARDIAAYVASGEWQGRAGGYAIQGLGAALVARIEGDYLNVVGLPAALLVRLLSERFAGVYGFG
jgi:septum formation protein